MAMFWSRWQRGVEFILIGSDKPWLRGAHFWILLRMINIHRRIPLTILNSFAWICLWFIMHIVQAWTLLNDYNNAFPHFQCKFYGRGHCFKGSACTFRHEQTDNSKERCDNDEDECDGEIGMDRMITLVLTRERQSRPRSRSNRRRRSPGSSSRSGSRAQTRSRSRHRTKSNSRHRTKSNSRHRSKSSSRHKTKSRSRHKTKSRSRHRTKSRAQMWHS